MKHARPDYDRIQGPAETVELTMWQANETEQYQRVTGLGQVPDLPRPGHVDEGFIDPGVEGAP